VAPRCLSVPALIAWRLLHRQCFLIGRCVRRDVHLRPSLKASAQAPAFCSGHKPLATAPVPAIPASACQQVSSKWVLSHFTAQSPRSQTRCTPKVEIEDIEVVCKLSCQGLSARRRAFFVGSVPHFPPVGRTSRAARPKRHLVLRPDDPAAVLANFTNRDERLAGYGSPGLLLELALALALAATRR
jgi:hypothetical protein